jgi:hypothetical protein
MENEDQALNEDQTTDHDKDETQHDASLLPAKRGKQFGSDYQPSGEAKARGKMKAKRNRELMQYILSRSWKKNRMNQEFHDKVVEMTGLTDQELEELTYESMLMLTQVIKAIKQGDSQAAALVMERAFGKPVQRLEFEDGSETPPAINITIRH